MDKKNKIFIIILFCIIALLFGFLLYYKHKSETQQKKEEAVIEVVSESGKYTQYYYEKEFKALKSENRELYDSLKKQQKYIESLVQFQYKGKISTDTIYIEKQEEEIESVKNLEDKTYNYTCDNDTVKYHLKINSKLEPNWYKFDAELNDKFTIVNKQYSDGKLTTNIESDLGNDLSDIVVWQKVNKRKWYQQFSLGPTVAIGYDPLGKNFGVVIGLGITYNIIQ